MLKRFIKVRVKLLCGFIGILLIAGFAGFTGISGVQQINYQNKLGEMVNEILAEAQAAQAAALRFMIYEDDDYYDLALKFINSVIVKAEAAGRVMRVEGNREKTAELLSKSADYRNLIENFRILENKKKEAQANRLTDGLDLMENIGNIVESYNNRIGNPQSTPFEKRDYLRKIQIVQDIQTRLNSLRTIALNYILERTDAGRIEAYVTWNEELNFIKKDLEMFEEISKSDQIFSIVKMSVNSFENYSANVDIFHRLSMEQWELQGRQRDAAVIVIAQGDKVRNGVNDKIVDVTIKVTVTMLILLGLAFLLGILIAVLLSRDITDSLIKGTIVAGHIADGRLDAVELDLERRDELGDLARALDKMSKSLNVQQWQRQGKEGLDDELRGDQGLEELAEKFIRYMTRRLGAQLGAFYQYDGKESLELVASYAFKDQSGNFSEIKIGEGLVGQAAKDREILYFSSVEDGPAYNYGVDEMVPPNMLAAPLVFKNDLIGTFLIGSFSGFSEQQKDFVEFNLSNIAVLFNAAISRKTINLLYIQAQHQQEELKEINTELEAQTNALKESEAEMQAQQEELRVTNEELEERTEAIEKQRDSIRVKNDELQRAQKEVEKKADDLEQASKYKSEFLANMSHELRTPLNSILILAQLLAVNKEGTLTEKQMKSASAIHASGADLLKLINEILDLSKVEAGKIEIHYENVRLSRLEDDLERIFRGSAEEKGLELTFSLSPGLPEEILTDSHRLQQILRNLLTNAVKFTEEGFVKFIITQPDENRKKTLDGDYIAFRVEDSGIGISSDKQAAVFEAFRQADGSTIRKYGGTGLGLSISRELAKLLGGEIQLESVEGKGSTFTLLLPAAHPVFSEIVQIKPESGPIPASGSAAVPAARTEVESVFPDDRNNLAHGDRSILIIEDDIKFLEILADLVREKEFKVLIAQDGETGLHFADYYRPSAIILDIGLPGIDGWTVMERLKNNPDLRHIPVHFMSGHDDSLNAMRMGAAGYLTKPVSLSDINGALSKLDRILSSSISRLLVVEDDDIQRESIRELIGDGDVEITDVSNGTEAFSLLREECFDCMILDLGLKDMSGLDLLEKIRNDQDCSRIPIIIYTGRELSREEEDTLNKYAESIIIKGVKSPERLLDETALFLHRVESKLPDDKQKMIREVHNKEAVLYGKTILLVDDDMRNVFALTNILEDKDMKVIVARDGIEALEKLDLEPGIDLVLMDIMMPRMGGYEAMTEIRKDQKLKKLPIIALTAKAMAGDRNLCIEAGASDYLAKPVDTEKLISMLRVWLY